MATFERVASIVRKTFRLRAGDEVLPSTSSADVAGWDSLSHASLIMNVEEEFEVELPLDRIYDLANVGELAALVEELQRGTG